MLARLIPSSLRRRLLAMFKRRARARSDLSLDHCLSVARAIVSRSKYALLITRPATGAPNARLVQPIPGADGLTLWIGTDPRLRKVREILADPEATIAYVDERRRANLILIGRVEVDASPQSRKRYWLPIWRLFFPEGPLGQDYVVLKFSPLRMELMSFGDDVVAEPFGLAPVKLVRGTEWNFEEAPRGHAPGEP
jgi:general stress protein 26